MVLLAACAQVPARGPAPTAVAQPLARMDPPPEGTPGRVTALMLAGEFALQKNDVAGAARDFAAAARLSPDPDVARRAVQLALVTEDADSAASLLQRWQAVGGSATQLAAARAQLAMLEGDRAGAEHEFNVLLAPGTVEDWKSFAGALLLARDAALAGRVLEDIAKPARLPPDASVWVALSELAEHLGRHAYARTLADSAARRFRDPAAVAWAASLRMAMGDRKGALALYADGLAVHPRNVRIRLGYAALLAEAGQQARALQVLAVGPQTTETWSARVGIAAHAHDTSALRDVYTALQRLPPAARRDQAFLLGQLAELLHHDGDAIKWYRDVDPDGANGFEAQVRTAVLLEKTGQSRSAHTLAAQLQQDYAGDPDNLRIAYELDAEMYARRQQHAQAIAVYDRALQALPNDPALTYDRGIEEANAGDTDAALADFRKVLAADPDNVDAMNALGFTLADADRDLPEATRLLSEALKAQPDAPAILDSWGWLQYRLGNYAEAEAYLTRAWSKQQDPDIGVHLGEALWKQGRHAEAEAMFAKVRKLDPGNASLAQAERKLRP